MSIPDGSFRPGAPQQTMAAQAWPPGSTTSGTRVPAVGRHPAFAAATTDLLIRAQPDVFSTGLMTTGSMTMYRGNGTDGGTDGGTGGPVEHPAAGYRPLIVVNHRVTDPGSGALTGPLHPPHGECATADEHRRARSHTRDQLRLAHLARMLDSVGHGVTGRVLGGVIGLDADVTLWYDLSAPSWPGGHSTLAEYDSRFADRLAVAGAAVEGRPALAEPSRITECHRCPWWPTCEQVLTTRRDVSLVLRGEDASPLRAVGVVCTSRRAGRARDPAGAQPAVLHGIASYPDAIALARAWLRGLPLVRRVDHVPVTRADVEVDIDMESFGESGAYLWGVLLSVASGVDIGQAPGYRAFVTWQPLPTDDEARSFAEFWGWLRGIRARCAEQGLSFAAYCYNEQAENRWLLGSADRFVGYPGIPPRSEVEQFIGSDRWVDMFAVVSRWFLCAHGKGLKRVAPVAGFTCRPEASGENSMRCAATRSGWTAACRTGCSATGCCATTATTCTRRRSCGGGCARRVCSRYRWPPTC